MTGSRSLTIWRTSSAPTISSEMIPSGPSSTEIARGLGIM
jgi:hypothetical protein